MSLADVWTCEECGEDWDWRVVKCPKCTGEAEQHIRLMFVDAYTEGVAWD